MSDRMFSSSEVEGYVLTVKLEHIVSAGVRSVFDDYPEDKPRIIDEALSELRNMRAEAEAWRAVEKVARSLKLPLEKITFEMSQEVANKVIDEVVAQCRPSRRDEGGEVQ